MRFYEVLFDRFCKFCKNRFRNVCVVGLVVSLFMPLGAIETKYFEHSSTNTMASALSNDFEVLFRSKLQREYRILSVFGEQELELHIQAILNSKVLIHDKWYKIGDKIGAYHIYSIAQNSITLIDKKSSQKILRLKTKDNQHSSQNPRQTSSKPQNQAFSQHNESQISLVDSKPISSTTKGTQ